MEHWQKLHELAGYLKALKPWNYLFEDHIFGVRDPGTGRIGFISFMGSGGEHFAMTVYLGERALLKFYALSENPAMFPPETILEIPQLQVSFEDRDALEKTDRDLIKSLGKKYSGKNAWPLFRSFRPGMFPWFLEETEQQSMIQFLEQALEVATRPDASDLLESGARGPFTFLVRDHSLVKGKPVWKDSLQKIKALPPVEIPYSVPPGLMAEVEHLPQGNNITEMDFFLVPIPVKVPGKRPFFSYILLLIDKKSGLVLCHEVLDPSEGMESMYGKIPALLLKNIVRSGARPKEIHVSSELLDTIGKGITGGTKIPVIRKNRLPGVENTKRDLLGFFARGR